jgi:hypothetical protein
MDAHKNFAYSTVAVAPSPPISGASLTVVTGEGARFPAPPFNATVWPVGALALPSNAEVVRVTARTSDTLTLLRAQESSSARAIGVGDQIAATITTKVITDIESAFPALPLALASGGTGANLSATGGVSQYLRQLSAGAALTVGRPASSDLSDYTGLTSWLPTLRGDSVAGAHGYTTRAGQWARIGPLVIATFQLALNAKDASMAGTYLMLGNLPVSGNAGGGMFFGGCCYWGGFSTAKTGLLLQYQGGLQSYITDGTGTYLNPGEATNATYLAGSLAYLA